MNNSKLILMNLKFKKLKLILFLKIFIFDIFLYLNYKSNKVSKIFFINNI